MNLRRNVGWMSGLGLLALIAVHGIAIHAQLAVLPRPKLATPDEKTPPAKLRADTNLVLVPVSVCDPSNHPVTGLEKEHFKVFEDKVEQTVTHFAMDDESVAVGLVLDISGSM